MRLIIQREREIQKFTPREYWEIEAELQKKKSVKKSDKFTAKLEKINNEKVRINNKADADKIIKYLVEKNV